ncbi:MAG: metallophosphoesterase [Anaerolineae bacterium]|nr:metallophosphoesterase [Anaerolineae bacterium]
MATKHRTVRRSRYKWGSIIWLLTGWLVACATTSPPESTPTVPPTAPITVTVLPTAVPATATPIPATAIPTLTLTPTPMPTNPSATALIVSPTVIPTPLSVRFAVIGDYGGGGAGAWDVASLVASWEPDFVITLGDNNYPSGSAETLPQSIAPYAEFIDSGRFFPILGNHDVDTELGQPYFDTFDLPGNERYYDFVRGEVHFFALNSDWREPDGINAYSDQANWLREQLANSTTAWQVVYLHATPLVSREQSRVPALDWPFAEWGADIVMTGHAHIYERLAHNEITYIVNGLGGHSIYDMDDEAHPDSQVRFNGDFGALLVEGMPTMMKLQFVTRSGIVVDAFELHRN